MSDFICEGIPPSRRDVLRIGRGALAAAAPAALLGLASPAAAQTGSQNQWRFCQKCFSLFFDGFPQSGVCPGGGEHRAYGWDFYLDYDAGERNKQQQYSWRYCAKCFSLFWTGRDGYRGVCPATAGSHEFQGYHFGLYYTNETQTKPPSGGPYQINWRYCERCHNLFYDGYKEKGRCPAPGKGVHHAYGWMFHLRYITAPPKGKLPSGKPVDRINTAFRSWLVANGIPNASLALMQNGSLLAKFGYGTRRAGDAVPVVSLSKAITAVCVSTLVDAGRLAYNDTIGTRLGAFLRANPPADKNASSITVSQLLRHRSRIGYDPTQKIATATPIPRRRRLPGTRCRKC